MLNQAKVLKDHLEKHMPELNELVVANVYVLGKRLGGSPTGHVLAKYAVDAWLQKCAPVFVMEGSSLSWDVVEAMQIDLERFYNRYKMKFGMYFINTDIETKRKLREALDDFCMIWFVARGKK